MGICYGKLGQKALALQALDMALELDPGYEPAIINRAVVESLKEGEKLPPSKVESVEYYKDYALTQKSYIQTLIQQGENSIKS
jgi:lipoprotein NlpI